MNSKTLIFKPQRCIIEVTNNCNLRCRTCILWTPDYLKFRNRNPLLTAQEISVLQKSLFENGIRQITYLGGEPFLNRDLLGIAEEAEGKGIKRAVVTNGTMITESMCELIVKNQLFNTMIFSIDGPEEIHDSVRGEKGVFKKACGTIKNIQKLRKSLKMKIPKIYMYATLSSFNYEYAEEIFNIARKLDVHALRFIEASFLSTDLMDKTNSLFAFPAVKMHTYTSFHNIKLTGLQRMSLAESFQGLKEKAAKIGLKLQLESVFQENGESYGCRYLGNDFVIALSGDVYPCPMLPEYTIGNVHNKNIRDIINSKESEDKVLYLKDLSVRRKLPVCSECCVEKLQ